jgi:hypothetical protein
MLTVKIYLAAMSRADEPAARMRVLPRFYFYVDEFQSMMNEAFADILSESRKYKLALTLANQYIEQMEENVRDAVFGNIGTLICFRVGPFDAEVLKTVFEPTFFAEDLVGLGIGQIYLTLMIDGVGSAPFSAQTIPPIEAPDISYRDDAVTASRRHYGRPRADVEAVIHAKQQEFIPPPREKKEKRFGPGGNAPRRDEGRDPRTVLLQNITHQTRNEIHVSRPVSTPAPAPVTVHVSMPTPAPAPTQNPAPVVRESNPVPRAPSGQEPRRGGEAERNSLRAAIERARKEGIANKTDAPVRSPIDLMREKRQKREEQQPRRDERPRQEGQQARREESRPERDKVHADHHSGEVSPHVLQQVLNGHHRRDTDDL